jgi:hypothetical protein
MSVSRQFVDSFGFSWQAFEIVPVGAEGQESESDGWLYFLSRGTTRRLRAFPREWSALSWSDLEDLCSRAEVVGSDTGLSPVRAFSERL